MSGDVDGYTFEGPTRFDKPFSGLAVETPKGTGTAGTEGIGIEDTYDGDYGRLLDRAYTTMISSDQKRRERGGVPTGIRTLVECRFSAELQGCPGSPAPAGVRAVLGELRGAIRRGQA